MVWCGSNSFPKFNVYGFENLVKNQILFILNYYEKSKVGSFRDPFCLKKRKGNKMCETSKILMVAKVKESNFQIDCYKIWKVR